MGTNYYRIPTTTNLKRTRGLTIECLGDTESIGTHLGKRSAGWLFCWNFHNGLYYENKQDLFSYIRSGLILDEYGEEIDKDEFINMAISWCQPDGLCANEAYYIREYDMKGKPQPFIIGYEQYDRLIDGLRVSSSINFS